MAAWAEGSGRQEAGVDVKTNRGRGLGEALKGQTRVDVCRQEMVRSNPPARKARAPHCT
ncbi:hypothetical protein [Pyrobaculum sp.]|uniref:hypothetical protein n=1 Tax=Pyrobaculum sp. TaxID=2004705 RepID=UPI003D09EBA2